MAFPITDTRAQRAGRCTPADRSEFRHQIVMRAEAFLNDHIDESVPIARLCQEVGVSERTLRKAFHEVRGMSPKRCALRARLAVVRHVLRRPETAHMTVTAIATGYGFFELGRFAGTYKAVFGETPSATLRSAGISRELGVAS